MRDSISRHARELIERAEQEERAPSAHELARVRQRVLAAGVGTASLAAGTASASGAAKAGLALTTVKSALFGCALGAATIGATLATERALETSERERAPVVTTSSAKREQRPVRRPGGSATPHEASKTTAPHAAFTAPPEPRASVVGRGGARDVSPSRVVREPAPARLARHPTPLAPQKNVVPTPTAGTTLAEELSVLEQVQAALREGAALRALELLDGSERFAHGQLRSERLAAEVFAACGAGQPERARRAATQFLRDSPATPTSARVRASCAGALLGADSRERVEENHSP